MNNPNLKDVILWTLRRGEDDTINMYNYLSELMQISTGKNFLNFGYWDNTIKNPADAQTNLCNLVGNMAELEKAQQVLDVGSGFSEPAFFWKRIRPDITVTCININSNQLKFANTQVNTPEINLVNATAVKIPISDESCDRIIALESAQHFRPIKNFISETRRILKKNGIVILAIPVLSKPSKFNILKIGILKLTWSSEHYDIETIKKTIQDTDLKITEIKLVGSNVYLPLAEYYIQNRQFLRSEILKKYPSYVEKILFKSMLKMKQAATDQTIEYVLIKCIK
ncbi:MAG TPA: class I SAM-dependent methyltransferase [Candidatus Nitrosotalea sp.]|nr:class I SAM-dependent methyltransferase [Candidatus Nitrosotalea sp.]